MDPDGLGVERSPAPLALPAHRDHRHHNVVAAIDELDRLLDKLAPHFQKVHGVIGKIGKSFHDAVLGEQVENSFGTPAYTGLPGATHDLHFSSDIAYSRSPAASRALSFDPKSSQRTIRPSRNSNSPPISMSVSMPLPPPLLHPGF